MLVGTVLGGRYEVESTLGQGGMGAVFRVADLRLSRKPWALKVVSSLQASDLEVLRQEANLLATLDHPNLPRIIDYFEHDGGGCLVMELVEGSTLLDKVQAAGALSVSDSLHVVGQLCDTLTYLHTRSTPIIFRDLKPANVMLTVSNGVKLIDFGIARLFAQGKGSDTIALGTPGYAAPEQYGKAQSDPRTDIYGLGATLYFALSGLDPADQGLPLKPLKALFDHLPAALSDVVEKCTAVSSSQRFATPVEVQEALAGCRLPAPTRAPATVAATVTATPPAAPAPSQADPTRILRPPWWQRWKRAPAPPPKITPRKLDFGVVTRRTTRQLPLAQGTRLKVISDTPWIKVKRRRGEWFVCMDGRTVPSGGRHQGTVRIEWASGTQHLPVTVDLQPDHASMGLKAGFLSLSVLSLIPLLGLIGFPILLLLYLSNSLDVRRELTVFVWITASFFVINGLFSEMAWIFFRHLWPG